MIVSVNLSRSIVRLHMDIRLLITVRRESPVYFPSERMSSITRFSSEIIEAITYECTGYSSAMSQVS
jgi:hypothetical protein